MKIVKENISFQRKSSKIGIKDKLFGFRPGSLLTYAKERDTIKPYIEVYMYIKNIEFIVDNLGERMETFQIGNLVKNPQTKEIKNFLFSNLKILREVNLFKEGKRGLTDEEIAIVKKVLSDPKNEYFIEKIKRDIGVLPILK